MKVGERRQKNNIITEQREGLGQSGGQGVGGSKGQYK